MRFEEIHLFTPSVFGDHRGDIWTTFSADEWEKSVLALPFKHDKFARSSKGVLRGLHGDSKTWKLVSCVYGEVFLAVVDARPLSKNYLKWDSCLCSGKNRKSVLIPPGFANGHLVLSHEAVFYYKLAYEGDYFDQDKQFTLKWDDPAIGIDWPIDKPILSERDANAKYTGTLEKGS